MRTNTYAYAEVGRAGLGNRLLPWARCEVFSREHNVPMLAPQWVRIKIGPLLRHEIDSRLYMGQFDSSSYIHGVEKWAILLAGRKMDELRARELGSECDISSGATIRPTIVMFRGMADGFASLFPHRQFIGSRLVEILSPRNKALLSSRSADQAIGVHIRRGDHGPCLKPGEAIPSKGLWNLPEQWFINCIRDIRKIVGAVPVNVFSDAYPSEISGVLSLPDTTLIRSNPAIVDLLLLSRSGIVVTSWSWFSMWAAFLSPNKSLWFPSPDFEIFRNHGLPVVSTDHYGNVEGPL